MSVKNFGDHFNTRVYQTTHLLGGAIMGSDPKTSVLNRYLQSWDVHNVFVMGASAFPQGTGYNPTGWWRRWPTGRPRRSASNT